MSQKIDNNVLLLQLLAHDLLAPLTAVKWQAELLEKNVKDKEKRSRYLEGIAKSTELGISIVKHVHVASKVLSQVYEESPGESLILANVVSVSAQELVRQYERHALALDINIQNDGHERLLDTELVSLLVWALGKYFLTCSPPNTLVSFRGISEESGAYALRVSSSGVPDSEVYTKKFHDSQSAEFDQTGVFTALLKEVSSRLSTDIQCEANGGTLTVSVVFPAV